MLTSLPLALALQVLLQDLQSKSCVFRSLYSRHTEPVQILCLLKTFFGLALIVLEELAQFTFLLFAHQV